MKKDLMKKLLKELQDNKREKEDKLNQVIIQTKSCADQCKIPHKRTNQTPNGTYIEFSTIMEETKNAELVEEKEKKLHSKNLIIHGVRIF